MSTSSMRQVSNLTQTVEDWLCQMPDKAARPKWNGQALKKHREARGWSVDELAEILGAAPGLIYKWENSESMPKADWLAAILLVLDVPAVRFFTGLDEFQARLPTQALGPAPRSITVEGEETGVEYYPAAGGAAAVPRGASPGSEKAPPATSAMPTSGSKRGPRSSKRRA